MNHCRLDQFDETNQLIIKKEKMMRINLCAELVTMSNSYKVKYIQDVALASPTNWTVLELQNKLASWAEQYKLAVSGDYLISCTMWVDSCLTFKASWSQKRGNVAVWWLLLIIQMKFHFSPSQVYRLTNKLTITLWYECMILMSIAPSISILCGWKYFNKNCWGFYWIKSD